jgi:response regulator RpfG family c-di-GMP phosphodiesterase
VASGVLSLDEHWNGGGKPVGTAGEEIPLYSRIALLAQVADIFQMSAGR